MAASSYSRAATPSGCADAAQGVFSIAALFSTSGPGPWCILPSVPSESDDLRESHLASPRQFTAMSATRYRKRFDSISYGSGISRPLLRALVDRDVVAPRRPNVELARTPDF